MFHLLTLPYILLAVKLNYGSQINHLQEDIKSLTLKLNQLNREWCALVIVDIVFTLKYL